MNNQETDLAL